MSSSITGRTTVHPHLCEVLIENPSKISRLLDGPCAAQGLVHISQKLILQRRTIVGFVEFLNRFRHGDQEHLEGVRVPQSLFQQVKRHIVVFY